MGSDGARLDTDEPIGWYDSAAICDCVRRYMYYHKRIACTLVGESRYRCDELQHCKTDPSGDKYGPISIYGVKPK